MGCSNCYQDRVYLEIDMGEQTHLRCGNCSMDIILDRDDPAHDTLILAIDVEEAGADARGHFHQGGSREKSPYKPGAGNWREDALHHEWVEAWDRASIDQGVTASSLSAEKIGENQEIEIKDLTEKLKDYIKKDNWHYDFLWLLVSKNYWFGSGYRELLRQRCDEIY